MLYKVLKIGSRNDSNARQFNNINDIIIARGHRFSPSMCFIHYSSRGVSWSGAIGTCRLATSRNLAVAIFGSQVTALHSYLKDR